jgi:soluble lytic murein transglycosylase
MVPDEPPAPQTPATRALTALVTGVKLIADARYAEALPLFATPELAATPLADYALYFAGLARLRSADPTAAREVFAGLRARRPIGFLAEAALLAEADAAEALSDHVAAARLYALALDRKVAAPDDVLLRLARSARAGGDTSRALDAYARVYAEYPLGDPAASALAELGKLREWLPLASGSSRYRLELARAERLYTAQRYSQARAAFQAIRQHATGDDRDLVALRLAECDFFLRRYAAARTGLRTLLGHRVHAAEARFYSLSAERRLGRRDDYERLSRELVTAYESSPWAEETLNNLASYYVIVEEDERADEVFREMLARFPNGRYADRAAWKVGWWAYKHARFLETAQQFESAARRYPRSDYRPAFLYWTARSYGQLGDQAAADAAALATIAAYGSSYYGRLAAKLLGPRAPQPRAELPPGIIAAAAGAKAPPTDELIGLLISLGLYDQALDELLYAQRTWGNSPLVDATLGYVYNRKADYRRGIIAMKRAYPEYLAAGGERLPAEVSRVIFPLDYWSLLQQHASARKLDPYLLAALIAQESSFDPDIRSRANAIGLMQILPSTGRRYARKLAIRRYSTAMLTRPEVNIQIGVTYFSDLMQQFGRAEYALCGYNAGENRIEQWIAERPGLAQDEFIDDVPFPETQNYLRKILGTAEDYRRLYGKGVSPKD